MIINNNSPEDITEDGVSVEIKGSGITNPGVYQMSADSHVVDLIGRAGGLRPGAYLETIPLSRKLYEEMTITIPTRKFLQKIKEGKQPLTEANLIPFRRFEQETPDDGLININRANHYELQELMGIGPILAGNIITYREEEGPFRSKRELKKVPGIGKITYEQLAPQIIAR
ncbi:MAG: helix-hairpin-helix domain-containing protein [bacterium]